MSTTKPSLAEDIQTDERWQLVQRSYLD